MRAVIASLLLCVALAGGCARYEFDLIDPPDLAGHIGDKEELVFATDAAEYRLRAVHNRLLIRLGNTTDEPITLSGARSAVVDPYGQSHPLPTQTIAPGSFVELVLPPEPTTIEQFGPSYYYGYGAYRYGAYSAGPRYPANRDRGDRYKHGAPRYTRYAYYDPWYYDTYAWPRTYRVYDTSDPSYWVWEGETPVRLTLVFETPTRVIEDRFVIARKRM